MWIKAVDGNIETYPYNMSRLKADNPNTAFPPDPSAEVLAAFNTYIVEVGTVPTYDAKTQMAVLGAPSYDDGTWSAEYTVENRPQDEAEGAVREFRDGLLASTDNWALSDRTMTQAQTDYRQALRDVPSQEGFPYSVVWPTQP
jgi:hypothetical protein